MATIAILDYGFGNVLSLENALRATGVDVERLDQGRTLHAYDGAVLPGVGKFGEAMRALEAAEMFSGLWNFYEEVRKPILGIGLGLQMLSTGSQESPGQPGLSLLPGTARSLHSALGPLHVGWHRLDLLEPDGLFEGIATGAQVHVTQDYAIWPSSIAKGILGTYDLAGETVIGALRRQGVWGIQFDPVKSGEVGQQVLQNFADMVRELSPDTEESEAA